MGFGDRDSYVRWQTIRITQLTYAVDIVLGFAVALLGFLVTLLLSDKFWPTLYLQKYAFLLALFAIAASVFFGICITTNRLKSFRATAQAALAKGRNEAAEYGRNRQLYEKLDERTWDLFWWQTRTFGIGMALTILSVVVPIAISKLHIGEPSSSAQAAYLWSVYGVGLLKSVTALVGISAAAVAWWAAHLWRDASKIQVEDTTPAIEVSYDDAPALGVLEAIVSANAVRAAYCVSSDLNAKAARWTAVAALLTGVAVFLGIL